MPRCNFLKSQITDTSICKRINNALSIDLIAHTLNYISDLQ